MKGQKDKLTSQISGWDTDHKQEIESIKTQIQSLKAQDSKNAEQLVKLREKRSECPSPQYVCQELECSYKELEGLQGLLSDAVEERDSTQADMKGWMDHLKELKAKVKTIQLNTCPTCEQRINVDLYNSMVEEQDDLKENIISSEEIIQSYNRVVSEGDYDIAELKSDEHIINARIAETKKAEIQYKELEISISKLEYLSIEPEIRLLDAKLIEVINKVSPFKEMGQELEDCVTAEEKVLEGLVIKLDAVKEKMSRLEFWKKAYGKDLKLAIFEEARPYLDSRTAYHLQALNNNQLKVEFTTVKKLANGSLKEDFGISVKSDTGGSDYGSLSGGEQKMANVAIGFALADLAESQASGTSSFMILDEPFTELSNKNCESIVEYLTGDFGSTKDTIILISNDENLMNLVPNTRRVVKEHGVTKLVD